MPREQLRQRLLEQKTDTYRACFDEVCQIELGKEVAASKSLATRILKVGNSCVVTSKLFDLKSATSGKAASARVACGSDGLLEGMDQLARDLVAPRAPQAPAPLMVPEPEKKAEKERRVK